MSFIAFVGCTIVPIGAKFEPIATMLAENPWDVTAAVG
jgi:hypothetical protein